MSDTKDRARNLLALRQTLRSESVRLSNLRRSGAARSRQALRRKRLAEAILADGLHNHTLPAHLYDAKRQARYVLALSALPELLSSREMQELETTLSQRIRSGATGARGKAAYWAVIGPPPFCTPGETDTARLYYRRIMQAIDVGGWTPSERAALYVLSRRWLARANGTDARFMEVGTSGAGRLPSDVERRIKCRPR